MDRQDVLQILRDHEPELKAAGIAHLRVFGSIARNEATGTSDVDLLADFDPSKHLTLVAMGHLQSRLTDLLGSTVDLSSPDWLKEPVRLRAMHEAVVAF